MAPEQAFSADTVDGRADIYALGVMLFEMIAGQRPVAGDEPRAIAQKVYAGQVLALSAVDHNLPMDLVAAVHKAMAPMPHNRFATASEVAAALLPFARPRGSVPSPSHVSLSSPSPSPSPQTTPPETGAMTGWSPVSQAQHAMQQAQHNASQPSPPPTAQSPHGYAPASASQPAASHHGQTQRTPPRLSTPGQQPGPTPPPAQGMSTGEMRQRNVPKTLPPESEPNAMGSTTQRDPLPQALTPAAQAAWRPAAQSTTPGSPAAHFAPSVHPGYGDYSAPPPRTSLGQPNQTAQGQAYQTAQAQPYQPAQAQPYQTAQGQPYQGGGAYQPAQRQTAVAQQHQTAVAQYPGQPAPGAGYYGGAGGPAPPAPGQHGRKGGTSTGLVALIAAFAGGLVVVLILALRGQRDPGPEPIPGGNTSPPPTVTAPPSASPQPTSTTPPGGQTAYPTAPPTQTAPPHATGGSTTRPPAADAGAPPPDAGADAGSGPLTGLPFPRIFDGGLPGIPSAIPPVTITIPFPSLP
jgi:eukaryotic-like serine/threonine-protein kinase